MTYKYMNESDIIAALPKLTDEMIKAHNIQGYEQAAFDKALASFVLGCRRICEEQGIGTAPEFTIMIGKKNARIVRGETGQKSVHCFVNIASGDVMKAAGWQGPAKHARGNIFDASNGLERMGAYGPAYL